MSQIIRFGSPYGFGACAKAVGMKLAMFHGGVMISDQGTPDDGQEARELILSGLQPHFGS